MIDNYMVNFHWQPQGGTWFPTLIQRGDFYEIYLVPGVFWGFCVDVVGSLVSYNIQCIFLLVIVHDLPAETHTQLTSHLTTQAQRVI